MDEQTATGRARAITRVRALLAVVAGVVLAVAGLVAMLAAAPLIAVTGA